MNYKAKRYKDSEGAAVITLLLIEIAHRAAPVCMVCTAAAGAALQCCGGSVCVVLVTSRTLFVPWTNLTG